MSHQKPTSITLSGRDVEDARRILTRMTRAADRRLVLDGAREVGLDESVEGDPRETLALQIFAVRKARERFLPEGLGSAGWDMLVALYIAGRSGARHTIGSIIELSGSSPTTGLRQVNFLEGHHLARRERDPTDRRMFYFALSERGREAMDKILADALGR